MTLHTLSQVKMAEDSQKQSEADMANLLSETVEAELSKQHARQSRDISALQVSSVLRNLAQ